MTSIYVTICEKVFAYAVKGERCVIIDTGFPGSSEMIIGNLKQEGINIEDISLILVTHGHTDHYGSAGDLRKITGAPIAVHIADVDNLAKGTNGQFIGSGPIGKMIAPLLQRNEKPISGVKADILIDDEFDLRPFGVDAKVIPTPGHTLGSLTVITENGECIVGDTVMSLFRKDIPAYPVFSSNYELLKDSIQKILSNNPGIVYSGHGGPYKPDKVKNMHIGFFRGVI